MNQTNEDDGIMSTTQIVFALVPVAVAVAAAAAAAVLEPRRTRRNRPGGPRPPGRR